MISDVFNMKYKFHFERQQIQEMQRKDDTEREQRGEVKQEE